MAGAGRNTASVSPQLGTGALSLETSFSNESQQLRYGRMILIYII